MFSRIRIRARIHQLSCFPLTAHWQLRPVPLRRGLSSTPRFLGQDVSSGGAATQPLKSSGRIADEEDLSWIPDYCPGCGAPSQRQDPNLPGHYSRLTRRQRFGDLTIKSPKQHSEENIFYDTLERLRSQSDSETPSQELREFLSTAMASSPSPPTSESAGEESRVPPLVCERCHGIRYHHRASGLPAYPTLHTLTNLMQNSPHTKNHIYHLIDAADLPMSLQPGLREHLYRNLSYPLCRQLTVSYIVTRADILMASERQISSLMTYIKKRIKDALPEDERVESAVDRIHVISTRNGWGVGKVKDEIRGRTGGVWIIGGVNVGKSRFVKEMWPEGGESRPVTKEEAEEYGILPEGGESAEVKVEGKEGGVEKKKRKMAYEHFLNPLHIAPTVSDVPGTTAAPIKIAYRASGQERGWGEMIDLPGFERWVGYGKNGLLKYVRPELQMAVAMDKRVKGQQYTIKSGQSMILGGLILITPRIGRSSPLVVLATPFTNLPVHIASTYKSLKWLEHPEPESVDHLYYPAPTTVPLPESLIPEKPPIRSKSPTPSPPPTGLPLPHHHKIISVADYKGTPPKPKELFIPPLLPPHFASAGVIQITDDVTLQRNPLLSARNLEDLPYIIFGRDVLLEGIGWVELSVQMSKIQRIRMGGVVEVEVFTPEGRGVGSRVCMGAVMMREEMKKVQAGYGVRQRKAMKGVKKAAKQRARGKG